MINYNIEDKNSYDIDFNDKAKPQKKYLLAGVNQSVEQLNKEQVDNLTNLLISLKSEYDNLTREVSNKKNDTEQIKKRAIMLERMDNKFKGKVASLEEDAVIYESNIDFLKKRLEEEEYSKSTYNKLIVRMKEDLNIITKVVNDKEHLHQKLLKEQEKQNLANMNIYFNINKIKANIDITKKKNELEKNEKDLIIKYYDTIINQKRSFLEGAEERKRNQKEIADKAKNETQDKQEVEKRKILSMCKLYNKFLRKKIDSQLQQNEELEKTFQKIKSITGLSNLKVIIDKILNKDKDYNTSVLKVTEKEETINKLKKDIKILEEEYKILKSNYTDEMLVKDSALKKEIDLMDEEEAALFEEEKSLIEEKNIVLEKHRNIQLVYSKVIYNLSSIVGKKLTDNYIDKNKKINDLNNDDINIKENTIINIDKAKNLVEDYNNFLKLSLENLKNYLSMHSKSDFENSLKKKGLKSYIKNNINYIPKSMLENKEIKYLINDNSSVNDNDIDILIKLNKIIKTHQNLVGPSFVADKEDVEESKIERLLIDEIKIAARNKKEKILDELRDKKK